MSSGGRWSEGGRHARELLDDLALPFENVVGQRTTALDGQGFRDPVAANSGR